MARYWNYRGVAGIVFDRKRLFSVKKKAVRKITKKKRCSGVLPEGAVPKQNLMILCGVVLGMTVYKSIPAFSNQGAHLLHRFILLHSPSPPRVI